MGNSLLMRTEATYSLNFLIYIQNIFLNQNQKQDEFKFPYTAIKYEFQPEFKSHYKKVWDEVSQRISENPSNDIKTFIEEKTVFYKRFFVESDHNLKNYHDIYQSFKTWWGSFSGQFSVERSIEESGQKLYDELEVFLKQKGIEPQSKLNISLIYDESVLATKEYTSNLTILSIKDFNVHLNEIVPTIQHNFL
jgi:L-rhamnose mutarotase